eukprot:CAMPEP_0174260132 /NCGR_PEP_ID=MMETSP0439-20130205/8865_1 /TAXON_ID=0 /ORGANISM="Stereomyxa ramosa, Strain Chinc5" /LENGTH=371 /DNA_ID=CAMNT_0015344307 /DNA_START=27 /DNA_END=1142 /DNA_ORIENTATION=-
MKVVYFWLLLPLFFLVSISVLLSLLLFNLYIDKDTKDTPLFSRVISERAVDPDNLINTIAASVSYSNSALEVIPTVNAGEDLSDDSVLKIAFLELSINGSSFSWPEDDEFTWNRRKYTNGPEFTGETDILDDIGKVTLVGRFYPAPSNIYNINNETAPTLTNALTLFFQLSDWPTASDNTTELVQIGLSLNLQISGESLEGGLISSGDLASVYGFETSLSDCGFQFAHFALVGEEEDAEDDAVNVNHTLQISGNSLDVAFSFWVPATASSLTYLSDYGIQDPNNKEPSAGGDDDTVVGILAAALIPVSCALVCLVVIVGIIVAKIQHKHFGPRFRTELNLDAIEYKSRQNQGYSGNYGLGEEQTSDIDSYG